MTRITIDANALRFARSRTVNYVYNLVLEFSRRRDYECTILVDNMDFADPSLKEFVGSFPRTRLVGEGRELKDTFPGTQATLSARRDASGSIEPGGIYHSVGWYPYTGPASICNVLTYFDPTSALEYQGTGIVPPIKNLHDQHVRGFDHIVVTTDWTRRIVADRFGVHDSKISVLYPGVDPLYEEPEFVDREHLLATRDFAPSEVYILARGSQSNLHERGELVEAFKRLCASKTGNDLKLVFVGDGNVDEADVEQGRTSFPGDEKIVFAGDVDPMLMPSFYHHAVAFVDLSMSDEFPLACLEAMRCACPVVCAAGSLASEILRDGCTVVTPGESEEVAIKLASIIGSPSYADSLRFAGLSVSKNVTWKHHVDELIQIYKRF